MGPLHYFLSIKATTKPNGLHLSQSGYISELLAQSGILESNECLTPMATVLNLLKHTGNPLLNLEDYRQLVGALQYLTLTRLDLSFSINKLCQFMHAPTDEHMKALKHLLRYKIQRIGSLIHN